MIRRSSNPLLRFDYHFASRQPAQKPFRHEHIVKPDMRIPRRKRVSLNLRVQHPISVGITSVEHQLDRLALQFATTDPDQRPNPRGHSMKIQRFARSERVKVSHKHVKPILMTLDAIKQRTNLARASSFVPLRKTRTQVQTEHARL